MEIAGLQKKTEPGWESFPILPLAVGETVTLISGAGHSRIRQDLALGEAGFCHRKFKANILLDVPSGLQSLGLQPGDRLLGNKVSLTIEKVGKACYSNCRIYTPGGCPFLMEILFLKVQHSGSLTIKEKLRVIKSGGEV